ncbi:unnamed protein product [Mesocestoides corti]|uniref:Uncharacterized protein n=1 Tax=Mesocestoides corti TaxID=53468 RepID=A0A0R3UBE6_MESCO|nr:unnamed protein product [Mesocestoides corti]
MNTGSIHRSDHDEGVVTEIISPEGILPTQHSEARALAAPACAGGGGGSQARCDNKAQPHAAQPGPAGVRHESHGLTRTATHTHPHTLAALTGASTCAATPLNGQLVCDGPAALSTYRFRLGIANLPSVEHFYFNNDLFESVFTSGYCAASTSSVLVIKEGDRMWHNDAIDLDEQNTGFIQECEGCDDEAPSDC